MKTVTPTDFLNALERRDLLWPPFTIAGVIYAQHTTGEIWSTTP